MKLLRNNHLFDYPEEENWDLVDSPKLAALARAIAREINEDFKSRSRLSVRPLRWALRRLAEAEENLL